MPPLPRSCLRYFLCLEIIGGKNALFDDEVIYFLLQFMKKITHVETGPSVLYRFGRATQHRLQLQPASTNCTHGLPLKSSQVAMTHEIHAIVLLHSDAIDQQVFYCPWSR